jgi:hypothetical protein
MKKRNFLFPVASLLSALSASNVDASIETKSQILDKNSGSISAPASVASNPFEFVMEQSSRTDIMAYHTSHASHASHRSHSSHYSSR